jgi:hypothetical protein
MKLKIFYGARKQVGIVYPCKFTKRISSRTTKNKQTDRTEMRSAQQFPIECVSDAEDDRRKKALKKCEGSSDACEPSSLSLLLRELVWCAKIRIE